jgi:hypothetical protein
MKDSRFREQMRRQLHPSEFTRKPPSQLTFRLMDLPVELRVQIAEYAMTSDHQPLCWARRPADDGENYIRGFDFLMTGSYEFNIASLSSVSKQLREETKGILFKANIFRFRDGDTPFTIDGKPCGRGICDYLSFRNKVNDSILQCIRSLWFTVFDHHIEETLLWFKSHPEMFAGVEIRFERYSWCIDRDLPVRKSSELFVEQGHEVYALVQRLSCCPTPGRQWRMIPYAYGMDERIGRLKNWLSDEDLKLALDWIDNGISI